MKQIFITLIISLCALFINAQSIDLNWSDKQEYENKKDGFFDEFIGSNSKFVYAKYSISTLKLKKKDSKIKIIAYDKMSMNQLGQVALIGFKENEKDENQLKDLKYYKTLVFENNVYVFWTKDEDELFVQMFDSKLTSTSNLKKIYQKSELATGSIFVIGNKKAGEKIIIGQEMANEKGEKVRFEYRILKNDLTLDLANQIDLPYSVSSIPKTLTSRYEIGNDGLLYIKTSITFDKEEKKKLLKNEFYNYKLLTVVNLLTAKYTTYPLKFENKNLFEIDYLIFSNKVKIYGLYSDLLKDKDGVDLHGIFYAEIDNTVNTMTATNFITFDKTTLDKLFSNDKKDQKKAGVLKNKKAKESNEESLNNDYTIENIQSLDNDNVVLFASRMKNYSNTYCNSNGYCYTRYFCTKSNVTAFKVNNAGKLIWASNLDRQITYVGWDRYDISVINKEDKMYVVYGSAFQMNADNKNVFTSKSKTQKADRFEYAVFDYKSGDYKKDEYKVNSVNTKKSDSKWVSAETITIMDNQMYINSMKTHLKASYSLISCFCPPLVIIPSIKNNRLIGYGYIGNIVPLR